MRTSPKDKATTHHTYGVLIALIMITCLDASESFAQTSKKILIDISHGQKFWNDPADMAGKDPQLVERIKYMTGEIQKTAKSVNAEVGYVKGKINTAALAKCDLLFIHIPSSKYEADEVAAIKNYLQNGGSLFIVMDANYWSTLQQVNANEIVSPFGIKYGEDSPDTESSGGNTKPSLITQKQLKVTYHGARNVEGGTPFCFNDKSSEVFGTFTEVKKGGKIVAMGDGMVSLYMTSWKDVNDYQCSEFMHEVFAWLLK